MVVSPDAKFVDSEGFIRGLRMAFTHGASPENSSLHNLRGLLPQTLIY
jgi:hypothetical protein